MRRRDFITLAGATVLVSPNAARAQSGVRRIGALMQFEANSATARPLVAVFQQELQLLGWTEGKNLRIDYRWAGMDQTAMQRYAKELVAMNPDLILASSSLATRILQGETNTIPIIFLNIVDPVGQGFVTSLSRPGGNITGFVNLEPTVSGKYVELLKEIAPHVTIVAIFYNPTPAPYYEIYLKPFRTAAAALGIEPVAAPVRNLAELDAVMAAQATKPNAGLIAMPDGFSTANAKEVAALAARHKLPTIYPAPIAARNGGLLSYGNEQADNYRGAATYADRILKGEKPNQLPVQFPVKFRLIVNLQAAKALGLDVPLFFQQRADEVID